MDIDIDITLNPIIDLILIRKKNITELTNGLKINLDPYTKIENSVDYNNIVDINYSGYNTELITYYIFLEKEELKKYSSEKILIEAYNKKEINKVSTNLNFNYETFGPTKDIFIITKRSDVSTRNDTLNYTNLDFKNMDIRIHTNYIFNLVLEQYNYNLDNNINGSNLILLLQHFVLLENETYKILDHSSETAVQDLTNLLFKLTGQHSVP